MTTSQQMMMEAIGLEVQARGAVLLVDTDHYDGCIRLTAVRPGELDPMGDKVRSQLLQRRHARLGLRRR